MAQRLSSSHRSRWVRSPRSPGKAHSLGWQGTHKRRFPAMVWSGRWQHVGLGNTVKADTLLLSALHMTVLGQDQFISKIICLLGRHPDPWTKEEHWGAHGQSCPCCRAHNWPTGCDMCVQMWYLTCINKQWRDRTRELPMLPESKRRRKD